MKFYIASKLENAARVRELAEALKARGWRQTYDWTVHGSVRGDRERLKETACAEWGGVQDADIIIVLLPGGRGTHTEFGMALAMGKDIVLHSEDPAPFEPASEETSAFYWAPGVTRLCRPFEGLAEWLVGCKD